MSDERAFQVGDEVRYRRRGQITGRWAIVVGFSDERVRIEVPHSVFGVEHKSVKPTSLTPISRATTETHTDEGEG